MARYEHLPIYKAAMDVTVYVETIVRNFSRYHKYTLGSDLRQQRRELVTLIIRANSRPDKLPVLH
ncbi:MAG: four helix bundle protein, partial [Nitrospirae bacterium]|nr:four helix bundle protein [Nitrospirota bacterium]